MKGKDKPHRAWKKRQRLVSLMDVHIPNVFAYVANLRLPNEFAIGLYVVKVAESMWKLGYESFLLYPKKTQPPTFPFADLRKYYRIDRGLHLRAFSVIEFANTPWIMETIWKHLRHQFVTWSLLLQTMFFLISHQVTIVETIDRELIFLLRLVTWWYYPKVIYDAHIGPKTSYEKLFDWLMRPRVDLFMVNCQAFKDFYLRKGIDSKKIIVLANGYEPDDFKQRLGTKELREKLELPKNKFIIGYVGRLETFGVEKGVSLMLQAVKKLKEKKIPIAALAVGGPEELIKKYQKLTAKLNLSGKEAIFHSHIEPYHVPEFLLACDVLCMLYPKVDHYYDKMSPLKMIEYMAAGKPIIASDLPSITQVLNDEMVYFVRPGNRKALEQAILSIWKNPQEARKKAKKAHQFVQRFSWEKRQKRIFKKLGKQS